MSSQNKIESVKTNGEQGVLEWLMSGNATAKLLDFFVTYKDFDYSETDIAELANVSSKTVFREIPKLESVGLIKHTRNVGRAKMYRLDSNSDAAKALRQFAFALASKQIDDMINNVEPLQQRISEITEENVIENNA